MLRSYLNERIGPCYANTRCADAYVGWQVSEAFGDIESVLNVGAGTGNREPDDLTPTVFTIHH